MGWPYLLLEGLKLSSKHRVPLWELDGYAVYMADLILKLRERDRRRRALLAYYGGGLLARELER